MMKTIEKCRGCGAVIQWAKTEKGKFTPVNPDGSSHWGTCPKAKDFKKKENRAAT